MISVILTILKIIGIFALAVIGILLIILLAVLFVPVRYRINASHGEILELDAVVSWLFHFVHARFSLKESKRRLLIRILGILIYDSSRPSGRKFKRTGRNDDKVNDNDTGNDIKCDIDKIICNDISKTDRNEAYKDKQKNEPASSKDANTSYNDDSKNNEKYLLKSEDGHEKPVRSKTGKDDKDRKISGGKIKRFFRKIKSAIAGFFKRITDRIRKLIQTLGTVKHKISLILDFLRNDVNKEGFRFTYDSIKKLLKHIKPTKLKSRLIFGTGDPCSTGQILGLFGILYSFYGNDLNITPDFEKKIFEGSLYARGRIRLWTILVIVVRFLLDKRFKDLKMNYQLLKEAL